MHSTISLAAIGMLAAVLSAPVFAADRDQGKDRQRVREQAQSTRCIVGRGQGMQEITNSAGPPHRASGWRYFSDPVECRAVVISPQGDYYYSHGKGLRWVAGSPSEI